MKRRAVLMTMAMTPLLALSNPAQAATLPRTTIIVEPHPDDAVLRLTAYILGRTQAGDRMILLGCSSGGASSLADSRGWSTGYECTFREAEQAAAWSALTNGNGQIVHLHQRDFGVDVNTVRNTINNLVAQYTPQSSIVEVYAAAHPTDASGSADIDHRNVCRAVHESNAPIKRYAREPLSFSRGNYVVPSGMMNSAKIADAMHSFGNASVRRLFDKLRSNKYASRTAQWDGR